jgi:uncharacterized protein YbaR (Trm112 family)
MKRRLLHNLACQTDGCFPMDLHVFEEKSEVLTGVLFCPKCSRWYPIRDGLPEVLPDNVRIETSELSFMSRWRRFLPKKVLETGKPFNLSKSCLKKRSSSRIAL